MESPHGASDYEYTALPPGSIRILELLPGGEGKEVQCRIHHESLDENPSYEALSYVWGPPDFNSVVACDGRTLQVTANLLSTLKRLQYQDKSRTLWVDAVCINQNDLAERSAQVQLMRRIYQQSECVLIWLGEDTEDTAEEAFGILRRLSELVEEHVDVTEGDLKIGSVFNPIPWLEEAFDFDPETSVMDPDSFLAPVLDVLQRDWFTRAWVVQEFVVATKAVVLCGAHSTEPNTFWLACELLMRVLEQGKEERAVMQMANMAAVRHHTKRGVYNYTLLEQAMMNRRCKATDPRDKLYALLGMSKDGHHYVPDYSISVEQTYVDFAKRQLQFDPTLSLFSHCHQPLKSSLTIPSWVPDWSYRIYDRPTNTEEDFDIFNAGGAFESNFRFSHDDASLFVKGVFFDRVKAVTNDYIPAEVLSSEENSSSEEEDTDSGEFNSPGVCSNCHLEHNPNFRKTFVQICVDLAESSDLYASEAQRREATWRTLVAGRDENYKPVPETYSRHFNDYLDVDCWLSNGTFQQQTKTPTFDEKIESSNVFTNALDAACNSYRVFSVTERGYLALLPQPAAAGDVISVLHGAKVPYLLRPQGDHFRLLGGECYVHGIMQGQALRNISDDDIKIIELR